MIVHSGGHSLPERGLQLGFVRTSKAVGQRDLTVAQANLLWCFCSWHSTSGSVPNQEHLFRALGRSVRDLRNPQGDPTATAPIPTMRGTMI